MARKHARIQSSDRKTEFLKRGEGQMVLIFTSFRVLMGEECEALRPPSARQIVTILNLTHEGSAARDMNIFRAVVSSLSPSIDEYYPLVRLQKFPLRALLSNSSHISIICVQTTSVSFTHDLQDALDDSCVGAAVRKAQVPERNVTARVLQLLSRRQPSRYLPSTSHFDSHRSPWR
jgi:hypothetical protein